MAYFYIIQNEENKKYYAGVKWKKNCDPRELLVTYHTSSSLVRPIYKKFIVRKIKEFDKNEDAILYEHKFLMKVKAPKNDMFYNQNYGNTPIQKGKTWYTNGEKSTLSYVCPKDWVPGRIIVSGEEHGHYGIAKNYEVPNKFKKGHKPWNFGLKGINLGPKEKIECPHCKKMGGIPAMKRWHFDNCKRK